MLTRKALADLNFFTTENKNKNLLYGLIMLTKKGNEYSTGDLMEVLEFTVPSLLISAIILLLVDLLVSSTSIVHMSLLFFQLPL